MPWFEYFLSSEKKSNNVIIMICNSFAFFVRKKNSVKLWIFLNDLLYPLSHKFMTLSLWILFIFLIFKPIRFFSFIITIYKLMKNSSNLEKLQGKKTHTQEL